MGGVCSRCREPVAGDEAFCGNCGQPNGRALFSDSGPGSSVISNSVISNAMPGTRPTAARSAANGQDSPLDSAALGTAVGVYVSYEGPEEPFDPLGNPKLRRQFFIHALLYFAVYVGLSIAFGLLFAILAFAGLGVGAFVVWGVGAALVGLLFLCLYWLLPVPAQLSEWKTLLSGRADAAPVIFDHIAWVLQQRQTPLDDVRVRRLKLAGGQSRDYLEVRRALFSGLVCCFAYGEDLYIGWTFWLRISPLRCTLMFLARLWQTVMRRGTDLYVTLRYDYAKAMRAAMDSSARQGVEVALGESRPQGQGTVSSMPVAVTDD